jgi:PDZ domain-containing secreted protein
MYDLRDQPGSAADKAGTAGFVIDKINGNSVTKLQDVCDIINSASSGQTLRIHNYNIDSGSDPTQLSAELNLAHKNPAYTADLKVP